MLQLLSVAAPVRALHSRKQLKEHLMNRLLGLFELLPQVREWFQLLSVSVLMRVPLKDRINMQMLQCNGNGETANRRAGRS